MKLPLMSVSWDTGVTLFLGAPMQLSPWAAFDARSRLLLY